ncbi:helix-turn-helix domain-containing protein [Ensifer sp.]|uniref:TetR/AcrR family transcriptional regulator n=1 Tax=Ensifer sp. TaxID=1872086 RepID=UPI00289A69A1|nr:helix-turn-helix domain-containing protein [Ensifer sp.]
MAKPDNTTRQRILDAALDIIEAQGMKALTQPKIAKATGLRQSHLTYYFPRKADLFIALLDASHSRAAGQTQADASSVEAMLSTLVFDRGRMRFLLAILLEIDDDRELQAVLHAHLAQLVRVVATRLGRPAEDAAVQSFVDELRGIGLRHLSDPAPGERPSVAAVANRHGISLAT